MENLNEMTMEELNKALNRFGYYHESNKRYAIETLDGLMRIGLASMEEIERAAK